MKTQNHRTGGVPARSCVTSHLTDKGLTVDPVDKKRIAGDVPENQASEKSAKGKDGQTRGDKV